MKRIDLENKRIIISRTDSIGDVMLTLPICAWIKEQFPSATIIFLGKGYTRAVVEAYLAVDIFEDWNDYSNEPKVNRIRKMKALKADAIIHVFPNKEIATLARSSKIPVRVGTSHRSYHLLTCTHRLNFSRKKSDQHEAQLNHQLLKPFGLTTIPSLEAITSKTAAFKAPDVELPAEMAELLTLNKPITILHPKSQGSAKEWPMEHYMELTQKLVEKDHLVVFTGTAKEGDLFRDQLPKHSQVIDSTGKMTLPQLIAFIAQADRLIACSTGPLHLAGYLGIHTIGFFSPRRPIHPGRWKALGKNVTILVDNEDCPTCAKGSDCDCIMQISVDRVLAEIA